MKPATQLGLASATRTRALFAGRKLHRSRDITLALHTVSEANAHEHWRVRQKRAKHQRGTACLIGTVMFRGVPLPCTVLLTRIAPRSLDSDNLAGSCKHVRDGIADALGIDDRDARVTWTYAQEKGRPRQYAVRVEVTSV